MLDGLNQNIQYVQVARSILFRYGQATHPRMELRHLRYFVAVAEARPVDKLVMNNVPCRLLGAEPAPVAPITLIRRVDEDSSVAKNFLRLAMGGTAANA